MRRQRAAKGAEMFSAANGVRPLYDGLPLTSGVLGGGSADRLVPLSTGVTLPHGVVRLKLEHGVAGTAAQVVLTYPASALQASMRYHKFGSTVGNPSPNWCAFSDAQFSGDTITR